MNLLRKIYNVFEHLFIILYALAAFIVVVNLYAAIYKIPVVTMSVGMIILAVISLTAYKITKKLV